MLLPSFVGGGAERVGLHLIEHWVQEGYDVDLVLLSAHGSLLDLLPPKVRVVDLEAARIRSALVPLVRYLRQSGPFAMQASMWPVTILAIAAKAIAGSSARVVVSEHSTLSNQYGRRGRFHSFLLRTSLRWFYPKADARIVVSHDAADDLARLSGLDRGTIEVIYNPVPSRASASTPPELDALWQAPEGRILSVGRMSPEKNHALLLEAFAMLRRQRPVKLMLLGDGPVREALQRRAAELGVAGDVIFPGFVLDPQPYYATANLFALSSDLEGYPLVLVEALRTGLPVVSTDCRSGPREILADGKYGRLVSCGDATALAEALGATLAHPPDPAGLRARGQELSGDEAFGRYLSFMLGETPASDPCAGVQPTRSLAPLRTGDVSSPALPRQER